MADIEYNIKNLDKILKALKKEKLKGRVGILGNTGGRDGDGPNNATVGAFHEFGTSRLPVRSFLRMPISEHLQSGLEKSGAFTKDALADVVEEGTLRPWLEKAVLVAESIVIEAFDTGGYGKWKPSDMRFKHVHMTLVETQQLRDSITSDIVEG